ncbi:MAG: alanyl-tRNA editing protein [Sphaerochaetaceae bacterium]
MNNSEPVYYQEPYRKELEATVLDIDGDRVILDRTICYPEGGGQPGDKGMIGGCILKDTLKDDQKQIIHLVDNPTFHKGDLVHINLDWDHRYFYMQVHTAQHMASGILFSQFGIGTVSVHDGPKIFTIETDQESIDMKLCYLLEDKVNQTIREGHPVHYEEHTHKEAETLGLRRSIKVSGDDVRLVIIEGVDVIACGGLHVANTTEVCLVQYVGQESIRGHVRLIFTVGGNALEEIRENRFLVNQLCTLHSAQRNTLLEVETQVLSSLRESHTALNRMKQQLCSLEFSSLLEKSPLVTWDITNESFSLKQVAQALDVASSFALCACRKEEDKLLWLFAFKGKYANFDFVAHKKELLSPIFGSGGGKAPLYQGVGKGDASVLFDVFRGLVK